MAILVEGIDMPKHDDEYVIFTVYGDGGVVYGPLNRPHVRYKNRAVPVHEPHGRLGDLDKLNEEVSLLIKENMFSRDDARDLLETIADAPTVVPASEEG